MDKPSKNIPQIGKQINRIVSLALDSNKRDNKSILSNCISIIKEHKYIDRSLMHYIWEAVTSMDVTPGELTGLIKTINRRFFKQSKFITGETENIDRFVKQDLPLFDLVLKILNGDVTIRQKQDIIFKVLPNNKTLFIEYLPEALIKQHRYREAKLFMDNIHTYLFTRVFPTTAEIAKSYFLLNDFENSIKFYRRMVRYDRYEFDCWNGLALSYEKTGNFTAAVRCWHKVLSFKLKDVYQSKSGYSDIGQEFRENQKFAAYKTKNFRQQNIPIYRLPVHVITQTESLGYLCTSLDITDLKVFAYYAKKLNLPRIKAINEFPNGTDTQSGKMYNTIITCTRTEDLPVSIISADKLVSELNRIAEPYPYLINLDVLINRLKVVCTVVKSSQQDVYLTTPTT